MTYVLDGFEVACAFFFMGYFISRLLTLINSDDLA